VESCGNILDVYGLKTETTDVYSSIIVDIPKTRTLIFFTRFQCYFLNFK
jgi:hypothetical protein